MSANSWQKSMYDSFFAQATLDSESLREKAKTEVEFLYKVLELPQGSKILDVACGTGRHSKMLAEAGYEVTGVDISQDCIDLAKKNNSVVGVSFKLGNMENLSTFINRFDCVVNLFSSFGYFSTDAENEAVLIEMINTLKPGGRLILNTINRDWLLSIYKPAFWFKTGSVLNVNAGNYDPETHYNESYMTLKNEETGETTLSYHRIRLYSAEEMKQLFEKYGLQDIKIYGGFTGEALDGSKSSHPIYIGTKK